MEPKNRRARPKRADAKTNPHRRRGATPPKSVDASLAQPELPDHGPARAAAPAPVGPLRRVAASPPPPYRRLRVYPFDPSTETSLKTVGVSEVTLRVPWEAALAPDPANEPGMPQVHDLQPGPVGEYLEVIDYDPASRCYYDPVNLNDPSLLAQDGLMPSEGNPQFHQQMVYAVAMNTIHRFERAMGRRVMWSPRVPPDAPRTGAQNEGEEPWDEFVRRLRIYPHAMREANAYYSPEKKALLLGYCQATADAPEEILPGGMVFTCLSRDVITHEMTHAILDGLQEWFIRPTNPDVLAFHEAFADIVALLLHCSDPEVLRHQIVQCQGDLWGDTLLGRLATQLGQAIGKRAGLRNAIGSQTKTGEWIPTPVDPQAYRTVAEEHERGAILVAAIFDAFVSMYDSRTADLVRLATGGSGILQSGALHPDLVHRLAQEAAKSATHLLTMCIRAIDYCPPVDITFGDFLRALITADRDMVPDDQHHYRVALIEAFRRRGIYPLDVRSMSEDSLAWRGPSQVDVQRMKSAVDRAIQWAQPEFHKLADELVQQNIKQQNITTLGELVPLWNITCNRRFVFNLILRLQRALHVGFEEDLDSLRLFGIDPKVNQGKFLIRALRPIRRQDQMGQSIVELVFSVVQKESLPVEDGGGGSRKEDFYGGATVVINAESQEVRYVIRKNIRSVARRQRWEAYQRDPRGSLAQMYFGRHFALGEPFAMLHGKEDFHE
jgi:hypothetical protein